MAVVVPAAALRELSPEVRCTQLVTEQPRVAVMVPAAISRDISPVARYSPRQVARPQEAAVVPVAVSRGVSPEVRYSPWHVARPVAVRQTERGRSGVESWTGARDRGTPRGLWQ